MNLKRIILAAAIGLQLATGAAAQTVYSAPYIGDRVIYVDTVADMLALPPGKSLNGQIVVTKRYSSSHTAGDGSGNAYRSDTGEGGTPDGGFIIDDTGTHWHAIDKTVVNVRQWGCAPGIDCSTQMSAAFTAASSGDLDVIVPAGTYSLDAWTAVAVSGSIRVRCDVGAIFDVQATKTLLTISEGGELDWYGGSVIDGASAFTLGAAATAHERLVVQGASFAVTGVAIGDSGSGNHPQLKYCQITDCEFTGGTFGVQLRPVDMVYCVVDNLKIRALSGSSQLAGVELGNNSSTASSIVRVSRVDAESIVSTGSSVDTHGVIVYYPRASITQCRIKDVSNANATNDEGLYTKAVYGDVSHNVLIDAGKGEGSLSCKGATVGEGTTPAGYGVRVTQNHVESSSTDHALIYARSDRCLISENTLSGGNIGVSSISKDCTITNNKIWMTAGTGIDSDAGSIVQGNYVNGPTNGIRFTPSSDGDWNCQGNHVAGTTNAIYVDGASSGTQYCVVAGNTLNGNTNALRSVSNKSALAIEEYGNTFNGNSTNRNGWSGFARYSGLVSGITASTTQSQGQQQLYGGTNVVATVANANDVVTLPAAEAGRVCEIVNNGAFVLQVFPASGDNLGAGLNTSTTQNSGTNVRYRAIDATNWEAL